jgi:hypothetical protein
MAFNGIFPAQAVQPASFGLLSVADVVTPGDEKWVQGFSAEFLSRPDKVQLLSALTGEVPNGIVYEPAEGTSTDTFQEVHPFFIEAINEVSGMGVRGKDPRLDVLSQLEATTQKAIERELWDGPVIKADDDDQPYLAKLPNGPTIIGAGAVSPKKALSLIEGSISNSPTGAGGVIHVTRDIGSILTLQGAIKPVDNEDGTQHLETVLGTKVVIGSGYTGSSPDGGVGDDTIKFLYATGPVTVVLGTSEVINEDMSQAFTPSNNDVEFRAIRPAAVYFDPSIYYAVQVSIPEAP